MLQSCRVYAWKPIANPKEGGMSSPNSFAKRDMQIMQKMNIQVRKPLQSPGLRTFHIEREIPANSAEMCSKSTGKEGLMMISRDTGRAPPSSSFYQHEPATEYMNKENEYENTNNEGNELE